MGREVVQVQGHVPGDPEAVWRVVRDFCGAWHPWVRTIRAERGPQGAQVRAFTVEGGDTLYREQLTYVSDSDRVLGYTHLEGIRDCEAYDARITVTRAEAGGSAVSWTATIRAPASRLTAICTGTRTVFETGIAALASRPRPDPAPGAAPAPKAENLPRGEGRDRLATLVRDDLPRLALTLAAPPPPPSPTRGEGGAYPSAHGAAASDLSAVRTGAETAAAPGPGYRAAPGPKAANLPRGEGRDRLATLVLDDLPSLALTLAAPAPPPSPTRGEGGADPPAHGAAGSTSRLPSPAWGGDGGGGPPGDTLCLFLHGIGGGRGNWAAQLQATGPLMPAAAMDLRGYGGSTLGPRQSTVDDYCADILRVAERLGARRLVLVGLSYGSWIATSFAMRHPGLLAGLVLSGGCTGMSEAGPDEREAFRVSREVPLDAGQTPADFAPAVVKVLSGPDASEETRQALFDSMAAIPAATYRDALTCFTNPLERFDFAKLTMPVLLMTGEHDRLAPPSEIRAVAGRIWDAAPRPDVRFEVIPNAGHVCNLEQPDAYNRHLLTFLRRLT